MKRIVYLIVLSMFLVFPHSVCATELSIFSDIEGHWAEASIKKAYESGIVNGYEDGSFKPDKTVSRAEFAKIITTAFNLDKRTSLDEYEDLEKSQWYYPYVEKSISYIPIYRLPVYYPSMQPYLSTRGKFLPNNEAVRMHVAEAIVEIFIEEEQLDVTIPSIEIMWEEVNQWYNDGYELFVMHDGKPAGNAERMIKYTWLAKKLDLMNGDTDGYFYPYGYLTRAELVTIIDRILSE